VDSGIDDILIITGKGKRAIEDHFDRNTQLERWLADRERPAWTDEVRRIGDLANIHYIRQKSMLGLGDAISYARQHVGAEPFAVLLGDTIIDSVLPVTRQLMDIHEQYHQSVIAVETVPDALVSKYGIVDGEKIGAGLWEVSHLIEKPLPGESASRLAIAGRYILTPDIFPSILATAPGKNNEIQLTDAMRHLLTRSRIFAHRIQGKRYDIGSKLDYLKTTVEFGLKRQEFSKPFESFLKTLLGNTGK
jgi:UTP--glucose-1-phosphate uridylyltransferase